MMLLNFLPHRELAFKRRQALLRVHLFVSALAGVAMAVLIYFLYQLQIDRQKHKNQILEFEIAKLNKGTQQATRLMADLSSLLVQRKAIEDLQAERNMSVQLLSELDRQLPEGVYISSLRQDKKQVTLQGVAQSNAHVSEFLRRLGHQSPWLARPELVEIVAATATTPQKEQRRVAHFTVSVNFLSTRTAPQSPAPPRLATVATVAAVSDQVDALPVSINQITLKK
jgi:type IV pilus assembly protein PilN